MPSIILPTNDPAPPCIGWRNRLRDTGVTLTVSSEAVGYERAFAADWLPFTWWKPSAPGASWLRASFAAPVECNYFAAYATDVAANIGTIGLQYSTDGGTVWQDAVAPFAPASAAPFMRTFDAISAANWRILLTSTPASVLGVAAFGMRMDLERGLQPGFVPPVFGRDTDVLNSDSVNGGFLGRTIRRINAEGSIELDVLTPTWMRAEWLPFMRHAESRPWFFLWDPTDHDDECALCWSDGRIPAPSYSQVGFMRASISYRGVTE